MFSFVFLLAFFMVYLFILKVEKIRFGNILTPFFFLTTPFIAISAINIIGGTFSVFPTLDYSVVFYWGLYAVAFWLGGFVLFNFIKKREKLESPDFQRHLKTISIISVTVSVILLVIAVQLILANPSPHYLAGTEFSAAFGQGLIIPVLRVISMISLIYLIGAVTKSTYLANASLIITLIPLFLYQIKGIILIPIIAGIIYRVYIGKLKINVKLAMKIFALGFFIFLVTYTIPMFYLGQSELVFSFDFLSDRILSFFAFLFSGILGFSSLLQSGTVLVDEPQRVISPFWNALRHITGWPRVENIVSEYWFSITTDNSKISNVYSLFGTLYGYLGITLTFFASFVIGFFSYLLKFISDAKENVWLKILHCFNLSILAFAWFDYYYFYTFVWMFWAVLFSFFIYFKIKFTKIVLRRTNKKVSSLPKW